MLIINNNSVTAQGVIQNVNSSPQAAATVVADESGAEHSIVSSVSVLALQLSAAATRAQARDASLDTQALGQKASQLLNELLGDTHQSDQAKNPANLPSAASNTLQTQAHLFVEMPRDQLALIAYDEGQTFSVAERVAALHGASSQEQLWRQSATQNAVLEYNTTGKMTDFFNEALTHFKSLALIEQSQYPVDYAVNLQQKIEMDVNSVMSPRDASPLEVVQRLLPESAFTQLSRSSEPPVVRPSSIDVPATQNISMDDRGRQLMRDSLFGGREPPVIDRAEVASIKHEARSSVDFLTRQDRELLSEIYAYVEDKDIDLTYVELMARDLGSYRRSDNGRLMANFNGSGSYNLQGWQLTVSFIESDAAAASRILSGSAINSTRLDQGFLRYILDPGYGAVSNSGNFEFIEHVMTKFSAEGQAVGSPGSQFSNHVPRKRGEESVMTASTSVRLSSFEPDVITEHGESRLTEKGQALGIRLESVAGNAVHPHLELVRSDFGFEILRQWRDGDFYSKAPGWLGSLWERLEIK